MNIKMMRVTGGRKPLVHSLNDEGSASCGRTTIYEGAPRTELTKEEVTCTNCDRGWRDARTSGYGGWVEPDLQEYGKYAKIAGRETFAVTRPVQSFTWS